MPSEPKTASRATGGSDEKQLCVSCMFPNAPETHFCAKCGAPLTSYASTGPFESIFAEGAVFRQAAERPRSLIVVIGIWIIFGMVGLTGVILMAIGGVGGVGIGALLMALAVIMIVKTTRNYCTRSKRDEKRAG